MSVVLRKKVEDNVLGSIVELGPCSSTLQYPIPSNGLWYSVALETEITVDQEYHTTMSNESQYDSALYYCP